MQNAKLRNWGGHALVLRAFLLFNFALLISIGRAADFGDVAVAASAMYSGNTFHGYAEMRVTLENRSHSKAHGITLLFPNNSYGNGNSIGRLTRTVKLEPGAREVVSFLQPPLPANGDNNLRVEVDGRHEGEVRAPNANSHCNQYSRGGDHMATVLISRSLNFDQMERVFQVNRSGFSAAMATGAPDASSSGNPTTSWMPDGRRGNETNWLELDYATPQLVSRVVIHNTASGGSSGFIMLVGISGTNLAQIPMSAGVPVSSRTPVMGGRYRSGGPDTVMAFSIPATCEPVRTVRLDFGKEQPWNIAIDAVEISNAGTNQWAASARASSDNSAAVASYGGRANPDAVQCLRAESPVSEWSENWLAYTPFDVIVLNAADMGSLSAAVRSALGDYLSAGGNVVVLGPAALPAAWDSPQKKYLTDGVEHGVGFGHCVTFSTENPALLEAKSIQTLREVARNSAMYWQGLPHDSGAANTALPVVENLKIPTRGIVIIMLAFIIIIGPVNIIYLNRRQRRTWMLWTIPAISVVTTLIVFAYSLLREGITPDTRIAGLTVIDQASHHATTVGVTAFYCPLTPSRGLQFEYGTEATPLVSFGYGAGTAREVDWTQAQHFSRGWVSSRVPVHFHLRKSETRRERIQVVSENGKLKIINGLGAPIKSIWVAYPTKPAAHVAAGLNFYHAENVAPGQNAGLIPVELHPSPLFAGAEGMLRDLTFTARANLLEGLTNSAAADFLPNTAAANLLPNSYLAVLEGNPFIENALGSAASPLRTKSSAVVFGILEAGETK